MELKGTNACPREEVNLLFNLEGKGAFHFVFHNGWSN